MKKLFLLLFCFWCSWTATAYAVEYKDTDSSCFNPHVVTFSADNLTCNADNTVSVSDADSGGAPEGTAVLSTGEGGASKFLREDGDGTSSWQTAPGGSFDSTAVDDTTWSDNANAANTWTFDVSGTDHTMIAGSAVMTFSNTVNAGTLLEGGTGVYNTTESDAAYAPVLGSDDNYVTDAEKVVIGNTSGTNSGDNSGTDDQKIDVSSFSTPNISISLESDGEATKTIDISTLVLPNISQISDITATASEINTPLDGATVTLTEFEELATMGATSISADDWIAVAALIGTNTGDNSGTDDQTIDVSSFSTPNISISLEGDSEATKTIDISSLVLPNISQITDITATASEINTPLDGALVTLTEFRELEAIGSTVISAADWTILGAITSNQVLDWTSSVGTIHIGNYIENVSTDLSMGTTDGTQYIINSSDGNNVSLTLADTNTWGIISDEIFDEIAVNTTHAADNTQAHSDYLLNTTDILVGTFTSDGLILGEGETMLMGSATISASSNTVIISFPVQVDGGTHSYIKFGDTSADPCGTIGEGSMFYSTANFWCGCDGTNDIKLSDGNACTY